MSTTADSGNTRPAGATPLPLVSLFPDSLFALLGPVPQPSFTHCPQ